MDVDSLFQGDMWWNKWAWLDLCSENLNILTGGQLMSSSVQMGVTNRSRYYVPDRPWWGGRGKVKWWRYRPPSWFTRPKAVHTTTIHHETLLHRLSIWYGIGASALGWFSSTSPSATSVWKWMTHILALNPLTMECLRAQFLARSFLQCTQHL